MFKIISDFSLSALVAGFVAVLIGFASSVAIVFQAAQAAGADANTIVSWRWALVWARRVFSYPCGFALR